MHLGNLLGLVSFIIPCQYIPTQYSGQHAEQEKKIAELEKKIAEQDENMAEIARNVKLIQSVVAVKHPESKALLEGNTAKVKVGFG